VDEAGKVCDVGSTDVNEYLRQIAGQDFTAKDFRTWAGTVLAAAALKEFERFDSKAQAKKNIVRAVERVAEKLGNTKAVCRKCYIHPEILSAYMEHDLVENLSKRADEMARSPGRLHPEEAAVLALLRRRPAMVQKRKAADARREAAKPKTLADALRRSLKLVHLTHHAQPGRRKAS
jgi:DNA topoisomerase-1